MRRIPFVFIGLIIACLIAIFAVPATSGVFAVGLRQLSDDFFAANFFFPVLRTFIFALFTTVVALLGGFGVAIVLRQLGRQAAAYSAFLLWPVLLGSGTVGFLYKILISNSSWLTVFLTDRTFFSVWATMSFIHIWQITPVFFFLFWIRLLTFDASRLDFAVVCSLSRGERVRDLYWPHCRNLAAILIVFSLIQGVHEYSKFFFVLHASEGTGSELFSHRILRDYRLIMLFDPDASERTLALSACFLVSACLFCLVAVPFLLGVMRMAISIFARISFVEKKGFGHRIASVFLAMTVAMSLFPVVGVLFALKNIDWISVNIIARSTIACFSALALTMVASCFFGFLARVAWRGRLASFGGDSLFYFVSMTSLLLVPPVGLAFSSHYWLAFFHVSGRFGGPVILGWLVGQVVLAFPLLTVFVQTMNFDVSAEELGWQEVSGVRYRELFLWSFWRRLWVEYGLVAVFGFSLIWNEVNYNSMIDAVVYGIPSMARELTARVDGRGAYYPEALGLILLSAIPLLAALALWLRTHEFGPLRFFNAPDRTPSQ